jgi:AraC-like DNA-binding protein
MASSDTLPPPRFVRAVREPVLSKPADPLGWQIFGAKDAACARRATRKMAGVDVVEATVPRCAGRRLGTTSGPSLFAVVYIQEGLEWGYGTGGRCLVKAGDVLTWHTAHTLGFEVLEPVRKVSFLFDANTLATLLPRLPSLADMHVPKNSALGPMLSGFFEGLVRELDGMPERHHEGALGMALDVVANSMRFDRDEAAKGPGEVLLSRLLTHVDRMIDDPALSPETLGASHGLSLRYLDTVFEQLGVTAAEHIHEQRLLRCREALMEQPDRHTPTDLARLLCFEDEAHLEGAFTRRFGVSPSEVRRRGGERP